MSRDFTESTAPLTGISWKGVPSTPVDERIKEAMAGDRGAIDALIAAHHRAVYRVCYRMMGNREDVQDIEQEVFLRMLRHLAKYDPDLPFVPWLYSIAMKVCRDALRKRKRRRTEPLENVPAEKLAASPDFIGKLDIEDEMSILEAGLETLPEKERGAIVLRDIEGLSTRDVAAAMGTKEVTVRSQISRARVKLKAYRDAIRRDEI